MDKDWLSILSKEFDHPAIVLWRAIELKCIQKALTAYSLNPPILDLGCAEGRIAKVLFEGREIIGLDNCWELLKQNKDAGCYKSLTLSDGCYMPYGNEVLGTVFSNCVIEHIPDLNKLLDEVCRCTKRKGIFLFTVPSDRFSDFLFFSTLFKRLGLSRLSDWYIFKRNSLLRHFHCYSHEQWSEILRHKGFELLEYKYYISKEATFAWDILSFLVLTIRMVCPLRAILKKLNPFLYNYLRKYYISDVETGSALLLVAQKG